MGTNTYNALALVLVASALTSLLVAAAYLAAAIVGWRGPHRKRWLVRFAVFAAMFPIPVAIQQALLFWVFLPSLGRDARQANQERADAASLVKVGDTGPSFRIKDADGTEVASDVLRGKVVVLNFFATWCVPCLHELPHLQEIWQANRDRNDFAMLVVGREETNESVAAFRTTHEYTFPIAADPERFVYSLYATDRRQLFLPFSDN